MKRKIGVIGLGVGHTVNLSALVASLRDGDLVVIVVGGKKLLRNPTDLLAEVKEVAKVFKDVQIERFQKIPLPKDHRYDGPPATKEGKRKHGKPKFRGGNENHQLMLVVSFLPRLSGARTIVVDRSGSGSDS